MTYGVIPEGFSRKPLPVILAEVEAQLITEFGPQVIQTAQSPLGQLNSLFANMVAQMWEMAEDTYQSYDPAQAEGTRLEALGNIRLLDRASGETDASYRQAITNEDTARIGMADFKRALKAIPGVIFSTVFLNETSQDDENYMPPNSIATSVLGGDDAEVAAVINAFVIPGITMHGNTPIDTEIDGFCRTVRMIRPVEIETVLRVQVQTGATRKGCPAPSPTAIGTALLEYLTNPETRPENGQDIDPYHVRQFIESNFVNVTWINTIGLRLDKPDFTYYSVVPYNFFEIAKVISVTVEVIE